MIRFDRVEKSFRGKKVISESSFTIGGGLTLLEGPSGCGKTVLIRLLFGLLKPDSGSIDIPKGTILAYSGQLQSSFEELSTRENQKYLAGCEDEEKKLQELAEGMGFKELMERPLKDLSGGERQKADILLCLAHQADLYVLDEPFANLDAKSCKALTAYLKKRREEGASFLIAGHEERDLSPDCILKIDHGVVQQTEPNAKPLGQEGKKAKIKLSFTLKALFRKLRFQLIPRFVLSFLGALLLTVGLASEPLSRDDRVANALARDPYPAQLYRYDASEESLETRVNQLDGRMRVIDLCSGLDMTPTGGYIVSGYGDDDNSIYLVQFGDGAGYYMSGNFTLFDREGTFKSLNPDDPSIDFLYDYQLFNRARAREENVTVMLASDSMFEDLIRGIIDGEFSFDNYRQEGAVITPGTSLQLPGLQFRNGFLSVSGTEDIELTSDEGYGIAYRNGFNGQSVSSSSTFRVSPGDDTIRLTVDTYLAILASPYEFGIQSEYLPCLIGADKEAAESLIQLGMSPAHSILSDDLMETFRTTFLILGVAALLASIMVHILFLGYERRTLREMKQIYRFNRGVSIFYGASSLIPTLESLPAFLLSLILFYPLSLLIDAIDMSKAAPYGYSYLSAYSEFDHIQPPHLYGDWTMLGYVFLAVIFMALASCIFAAAMELIDHRERDEISLRSRRARRQ